MGTASPGHSVNNASVSIDDGNDAENAELALVDRHFSGLSDDGAERFVHSKSDAARALRAPADLLCRDLECRGVPLTSLQEREPELVRVLLRRGGELIDRAFHRERCVSVADGSPPKHRDGRRR